MASQMVIRDAVQIHSLQMGTGCRGD
ncbi:hypothetical protein EYZ11_013138 [Aspergillus tanneri]|uniref:Uncharacterized protein n=1 Tax=Aspergillus tanneri TaxID=1220188 RepID=A0A4S3IYF1_9EURO|nr:hypothetical protein EYZ11_013138 [Aspergillus tanneri]